VNEKLGSDGTIAHKEMLLNALKDASTELKLMDNIIEQVAGSKERMIKAQILKIAELEVIFLLRQKAIERSDSHTIGILAEESSVFLRSNISLDTTAEENTKMLKYSEMTRSQLKQLLSDKQAVLESFSKQIEHVPGSKPKMIEMLNMEIKQIDVFLF
jgi:hypothetical protein